MASVGKKLGELRDSAMYVSLCFSMCKSVAGPVSTLSICLFFGLAGFQGAIVGEIQEIHPTWVVMRICLRW